jgi:hypothetical protein
MRLCASRTHSRRLLQMKTSQNTLRIDPSCNLIAIIFLDGTDVISLWARIWGLISIECAYLSLSSERNERARIESNSQGSIMILKQDKEINHSLL